MNDRTDPLHSDLDVELAADELTEFWDRAYAMGIVITINLEDQEKFKVNYDHT